MKTTKTKEEKFEKVVEWKYDPSLSLPLGVSFITLGVLFLIESYFFNDGNYFYILFFSMGFAMISIDLILSYIFERKVYWRKIKNGN